VLATELAPLSGQAREHPGIAVTAGGRRRSVCLAGRPDVERKIWRPLAKHERTAAREGWTTVDGWSATGLELWMSMERGFA